MIRLSSPSDEVLADVRHAAAKASPTHPADGEFRRFDHEQTVGHGRSSFETGKDVLRNWAMHRGAGVHVESVPLAIGNDVVLWTRVLVLHLVFACRITDVFDDESNFGFTYATLPGHPEQGVETFRLQCIDDVVQLHITGESRPALLLNRLSGPIGPILQRRITSQYIEAMRSAIRAAVA